MKINRNFKPKRDNMVYSLIRRILPIILMNLIFSGFLPVFAQTFTPPANSPLAKHQHPRLFFTKESLRQRYINEVDQAFIDDPSRKPRNFLLLDANNFAFLSYALGSGLFSNYVFARSAEEYARKAYDHAEEISRRQKNKKMGEQSHAAILRSDSQGGYVNLALGVVYDWCYEYLSLSQKQMIADALIYSYANRDKDTNPGGKVKLGLTFSSRCHDVGVGGLALWGDPLGSQYVKTVREMLDSIQWLWLDRVLLMGEHLFEGTAGWGEGANYFNGAATTIIWFTAAISSATGQDLFTELNWLHDIPKYLYFYVMPMSITGEKTGFFEQRNDAVDLGDWEGIGSLQRVSSIAGLIKKNSPEYAGFYRWISEDSKYRITKESFDKEDPRVYWLFYKFLWGIKDIEKKTPQQIGLKKSYRFGLGDVILESDLLTEDATKINFYTPRYHLARHYHKDNASFVIFKYGNLALDAGVTKGTSHLPKSEKSNRPIYHNLLALVLPNGSSEYSYDMDTYDYADSYKDADNQPGGRNHVGDVLALRFEPDIFDFVDYDYTRSYKGANYAVRLRRKLLYIRDPDAPAYTNQEYVLIFDDTEVSNPAIRRRWLLHTPSGPELIDGSWKKEGGGFWTSNSGSIIKVTCDYANSHGRMFVKFLAPGSYHLRLRGGSEGDKHYWFTDANGKDLTKRGPFSPWGAFWAGTHRLEVENLAAEKVSQYLTVMQIGDSNTLSQMAAAEKIEAGDFIGAFINGDRVAFFNRTVSLSPGLVYGINSSKTVRHIITGLQPGRYALYLDANKLAEKDVSDDGTLYFDHKGGGKFTITRL
jgi:hypothetical protein